MAPARHRRETSGDAWSWKGDGTVKNVMEAMREKIRVAPDADLDTKIAMFRTVLAEMGTVVVAYSGGVDSALVAAMAHDTLGAANARIVTAISPSLADSELADARALATERGWRWLGVDAQEMENAAYRRNDAMRCYHCKDALMDAVGPVAREMDATVLLGVNVDDLGDHRPGQQAAAVRGARFPMVEAGLTKQDVRDVSRRLGLRTWDKPAAACLASRLPYGTPVTLRRLTEVEQAEFALRRMGFDQIRVRHEGPIARIEIPLDDFDRFLEVRGDVVTAVRKAGYNNVTLDLEGLRSGNLNERLDDAEKLASA